MKVLDLFCGCGGMSLGFQNSGFQIIGAYDFWDKAVDTYNANMDHTASIFDLSDVAGFIEKFADASCDVIIGGPPCQDFSSAGKRTERERANLTNAFAEIITSIRPTYFVMENVARTKNSRTYNAARNLLIESGYGLTEVVLDASYCGVPQIRKRFFCIGALGQSEGFMSEILENRLSSKQMSLRDYFGADLNIDHYYRHPRTYNRRGVFSVDEPSMTIRGVNRPIPGTYQRHHGDTAPIDEKVRPLSTQERAMVQTFPRNFTWIGSKTAVEQMIGNAVPVNLAKYVADCITTYHSNESVKKQVA